MVSNLRPVVWRCVSAVALLLSVVCIVAVSQRVGASAASYETSTPPCGGVEFPTSSPVWGSGSWLIPVGGVDVYSNSPQYEGTGSSCDGTGTLNGTATGDQYQCMEFINRLYLSEGWISGGSATSPAWGGDAGQPAWNDAPPNLSKQEEGSISYLGPGDVVDVNVYDNGQFEEGHVLVVNDSSDVTSGTVDLVSENSGAPDSGSTPSNSEPIVPGVLSGGDVSVGGGGSGWTYTTIGVIHAPSGGSGSPPPSAPSTLTDGGDDVNDVTLSWSEGSGGVGGVAGYDIYRNGQLLSTTSGVAATSYVDTSIIPGTELTYGVTSVDTAGNQSAMSPTVTVYTYESGEGDFELNTNYGPTYCSRVGDAGTSQALECTVFNGTSWTSSASQPGEDWGYDVGWAWVSDQGNPAYCSRVGDAGTSQALECTVFNGTSWTSSASQPGEDWGYDDGLEWLSDGDIPLSFSSAPSASFTVGSSDTFSVTTTGFPTPSLAESGTLPSGVTFTNNGNGTATLAGTPALGTVGSYAITITASNGVPPDATQSFTLTVSGAASTTTPTASPSSSTHGAKVKYTASVSSSTSGTPTGTVAFSIGSVNLCMATLKSGKATCASTKAPTGTDTVSAAYSGDTSFATSVGTTTLSVTPAPTTTTASVVPTTTTKGKSVTYSAKVTSAGGAPGGQVTFTIGSKVMCSATIKAGTASCTSTKAPKGTDTVSATYKGSTNFATSVGTTSLDVT
jgi:hypothetical protein